MRAGQYSVALCGPRQADGGGQEPSRLLHGGRLLERLAEGLVGAQALEVPRVELAQVTPRARAAEVLDGAVHDPVELVSDLVGRGVRVAGAEELREEPRVAERAAREHDGGGAGAVVCRSDGLRALEAAGEDDGRFERLDQLRG